MMGGFRLRLRLSVILDLWFLAYDCYRTCYRCFDDVVLLYAS